MNSYARPDSEAAGVVAEGLSKSYAETEAVRGLSLTARPGEVLGLLGPNGAGKTTTIKMLTTLLPIDEGNATVVGFDVATQPHAVRQVVGLAGQAAAVDEMLTARENLELFGRLYKIPKSVRRDRIEWLIERFELGEFAKRPAGTYSGGQRRRLDVVASLIAAPPVLFLDEPTAGLDPRTRSELWGEIRRLAGDGTTVVLTTQYLEEADQLSDRIVIIDKGAVKAAGTVAELKDNLERNVLEVRLKTATDLDRVTTVLSEMAAGLTGDAGRSIAGLSIESGFSIDTEQSQVQIPLSNGASQSMNLLRRLDDARIDIVDFQLRRPTLDDVFLSLTSNGAAK